MAQLLRQVVRRAWHRHLDAADRTDAGNVSAYPMLNTLIVDLLDADDHLAHDPRYAYGVVHGLYLASQTGVPEVMLVEFGTGPGGGVDKLERLADLAGPRLGVDARVVTFDVGSGVPPAESLRDLPHQMGPGDYADFDPERVRRRFRRASTELVLGPFAETVPAFTAADHPPVAFLSLDTGSYSGSCEALRLIRESDATKLLPRVQCFCGPVLAYSYAWFNAERGAIARHNDLERDETRDLGWRRPISPIYGLRYHAPRRIREQPWVESYFLAHISDHPQYATRDGMIRRQMTTQR